MADLSRRKFLGGAAAVIATAAASPYVADDRLTLAMIDEYKRLAVEAAPQLDYCVLILPRRLSQYEELAREMYPCARILHERPLPGYVGSYQGIKFLEG